MGSMQHFLTKEGYIKLKNELEYLKTVARKEVIERIATAKELGDLKENAEYAEAKDDQGHIESKILELEDTLKNAVIVDEGKKGKQTHATIGSNVVVVCDDRRCSYAIVGPEEADPSESKISFESPLGKAFLNKEVGDSVTIKVPRGEFTYKILEIN